MPSFIAESYVPRSQAADLGSLAERARQAAATLSESGWDVEYVRSALVPDDELCQHWFTASSSTVVTEVARLAALEWERVVEAVERDPKEET